MIPIVSVVGKKNSGKTTFLEKLIPELRRRGYRVGTLKHDVHGFEIDHPGKDTWRMAQAGADAVAISSPERLAIISRRDREAPMEAVAAAFGDSVDIMLTEGYKRSGAPKVEVSRRAISDSLLCTEDELIAIVSDQPFDLQTPQFDLDDAAGVAQVVERLYLRRP